MNAKRASQAPRISSYLAQNTYKASEVRRRVPRSRASRVATARIGSLPPAGAVQVRSRFPGVTVYRSAVYLDRRTEAIASRIAPGKPIISTSPQMKLHKPPNRSKTMSPLGFASVTLAGARKAIAEAEAGNEKQFFMRGFLSLPCLIGSCRRDPAGAFAPAQRGMVTRSKGNAFSRQYRSQQPCRLIRPRWSRTPEQIYG